MKALQLLSILFISIFTFNTSFAQKASIATQKTIKVWGECGMCKKKIESSASKAGATSAIWDVNSKILTVSYNPAKTNTTKIQEAIAAAGYDTQDATASDAAYRKLDECCQYERKAAKQ